MARIKLLRLGCLSCTGVGTRSLIGMTVRTNISLGLLHQSVGIVKHSSVRRRYRAWVIMRLQHTLLKSILNRKVVVSCGSRCFTELLLDCLFNAGLLIVGLDYHHFARILLDCVLLHIRAHSHLLR